MIIKISSKNKKALIKDKIYIGTSMYKDKSGVIWDLTQDNSDFIISRVARKSDDNLSSTKDYWSRIFTEEMIKKMFEKRVAPKVVKAQLEDKGFTVKTSMMFDDKNIDIVFLDKNNMQQLFCIDELGNKIDVQIPTGIKKLIAKLDTLDAADVVSEMLASNQFVDYISAKLLYTNNSQEKRESNGGGE